MTGKILVLTTAGSEGEAHSIAHALVELRLAACVNIIPRVSSVYQWQGEIEKSEEWLLVVKTTSGAFERVREAIEKLHSYELPECVCVAIEDGSPQYLQWIAESVK